MCPRGVFFAKPCSRDPHVEGSLEIGFPTAWAVDMGKTLEKIAFQVSEKFVVETFNPGNPKPGGASYTADVLEPEKLHEFPKGISSLPMFNIQGYQEVLASGFKLGNMKVDATKGESRRWYVLYEGATDALRQKPELATDTKLAEDMLGSLAAATEEDDVAAWINNKALLYAVHVKEKDSLAED